LPLLPAKLENTNQGVCGELPKIALVYKAEHKRCIKTLTGTYSYKVFMKNYFVVLVWADSCLKVDWLNTSVSYIIIRGFSLPPFFLGLSLPTFWP
jgi:hypothetical protein